MYVFAKLAVPKLLEVNSALTALASAASLSARFCRDRGQSTTMERPFATCARQMLSLAGLKAQDFRHTFRS